MNIVLDTSNLKDYTDGISLNERNCMSKLKNALAEDFSVLVGDELDNSPENEEEFSLGMTLHSIESDILFLEKLVIPPREADRLRRLATKLNELADLAEKPF